MSLALDPATEGGHPSGPLVDLGWEPGLGLFEALGALVLGLVPYAYWS